MLYVFGLFWLLIGWGLYDGDIYAKEATIFGLIWCVLLGFFFWPPTMIPSIIGLVLLTIVLVMKTIGKDVIVH